MPTAWGRNPHWVAPAHGGYWHHTYCPPGGIRYDFRGGGYYYAPHHYSWVRWGGGWGWGCYGWWGGRYVPYRWGCHPHYGWGYWPWDVTLGSWIVAAAVASSMAGSSYPTTTTTTTVITGTPVQQVAVGSPVVTGTAVSQPTYQYQTPNAMSATSTGSMGAPTYQVPPPGFGFPYPEFDGKSDPPSPPQPDSSSGSATSSTSKAVVVDETKYMTSPPEKLSEPIKIDFDYSRPPADHFADQSITSSMSGMKVTDSSGMGGGMSSSSGGMGGGMSSSSSGMGGGMSSSSSSGPVG